MDIVNVYTGSDYSIFLTISSERQTRIEPSLTLSVTSVIDLP